jgi:hypothetical protein
MKGMLSNGQGVEAAGPRALEGAGGRGLKSKQMDVVVTRNHT